MTSRERFLATARGEKADKIPAAPYNGNFGATFTGIPISIYNTNPVKMAEAHIRTYEALGQDVVVAQSDNYYIAEGFGCVISQPYNTTPNLVHPAVETLNEIGTLKVPDPYKDGRMPVYLEAVSRLRNHFGDEVAIRGPGTGPFSLASYLMGGTSEFLMEIATAEAEEDRDKERRLLDLMELSSDGLIAFLKALLEAGSDTVQAGDSLASLSMISPAIYEKYAYPFECKVFSALEPLVRKRGATSILHICGDTRKILPFMAMTGADILEIDAKVDMADAKSLVGTSVVLMGNLEPTTVLFQGSPESVRAEAIACMRAANALSGNFILGSGCEVVPGTPMENMRAFVEAAHSFKG